MKLNADLSKRAVVHSADLDWVPSPLPGVERRMLERDGGEVARATSVVRYAPGSSFKTHTHGGGEEYLVLEGVFSDESGDFPAGYYVRNPPGSSHTPLCKPGCTILVKLWQMPREDQTLVELNTREAHNWHPGRPGESCLDLHHSDHESVTLLRWEPGASLAPAAYPGGVEYFVVEGTFADEQGFYRRGSWLRLPPGSHHGPRSSTGALVYRKTAHLLAPPPLPGPR